jgi:hypothetical protein
VSLSAIKLRQNLYSILDRVLETGIPVEIERNCRLLVIESRYAASKWDMLEEHHIIVGDSEDIVHKDWSGEWKGLGPELDARSLR